ncbi:MAG: hypothetical protein M1839_005947 [Geoglossum umbratile]|nr:MAG: hypothetical protein M1839_005947 [Geoglossum umbratile]
MARKADIHHGGMETAKAGGKSTGKDDNPTTSAVSDEGVILGGEDVERERWSAAEGDTGAAAVAEELERY